MIPYVLLLFFPVIFSSFIEQYRCKYLVDLDEKQRVQNNNCLLPVFFLMLMTILALRDETIGRDLRNYKFYFEAYSSMELEAVFHSERDVLFYLLNWIVGRYTDNYQIFLTVVAVLTVLPLAIVYTEDKRHGFLKTVLFMNMSTFVMLFSGLRQSIAIAIGVVAYEFVKRKRPIIFLLFAFLAWGFHHSAFMILLFYPLYHIAFKKKHLWFVVPAILMFFVFNNQIFTWATNILDSEKYSAEISNTGAYTMLILFIMFAVFSYIIPDENKMDKETLGLRNFLLIAVLLQCFSPVHTLAMRINYYYIIFIPILLPKIIACAKDDLKEIADFAKIVLTLFFISYYMITIYNSCQTGISALNTYPYVPFWK